MSSRACLLHIGFQLDRGLQQMLRDTMVPVANVAIARRLREVADLLGAGNGNVFRVAAYRNAARAIEHLERPVAEVLAEGGDEALRHAIGTGERLTASIRQLVECGALPLLERLRAQTPAETLLATIPGIGETRARLLHQRLGIESLEDLELAAFNGRLRRAGFGKKRMAAVLDAIGARLGRPVAQPPPPGVPVEEILDVDREYRHRAALGELRKIAPKRFNPQREAWLPILHTHRGARGYTALFSNTARAHQLGKTEDWVVIYLGGGGPSWTVVTETRGPLAGQRVVRGREAESLRKICA
jgi:hypothetical protein